MSLTILAGATLSATGGTSKTYTPDGVTIVGGAHLSDASVTDFRVRPTISAKAKMPSLAPDGGWSKGKYSLTHSVPMTTASGKVVFNLVRVELEVHPELSAADALELRNKGAQLLFDSDLTNFWQAGSLVF